YDMPAKPRIAAHRTLEVDDCAVMKMSQARPIERLARHFGRKHVTDNETRREANAIHRNTRTGTQIIDHESASHADRAEIPGVANVDDLTHLFDDPCEHIQSKRDRARRMLRSSPAAESPRIIFRCLHRQWPESRARRGSSAR